MNENDNFDARQLATALLLAIEERGKDATGMALRTSKGGVQVVKRAVRATTFTTKYAEKINPTTRTAVFHTRFATNGSWAVQANNHPIVVGGRIVGVHNGVLWNDDTLFRQMDLTKQRVGEVDSEAAFAAIAYGLETASDGKTRIKGAKTLTDVLESLEGSAALAWLDIHDEPDVLHVSRVSDSPTVVAQTANGSFFFASTAYALEAAEKVIGEKFTYTEVLKEGTYLKVEGGRIEDALSFDPPWSGYRRYYGNTVQNTTSSKKDTHIPAWDDDYDCEVNEATKSASESAEVFKDDLDKQLDVERRALAPLKVYGETEEGEEGEEFLDPEALATDLLVDKLETMRGSVYEELYEERENVLNEYLSCLKCEGDDSYYSAASTLFGFARPGNFIKTLFGDEWVYGQLYDLPQTFPGGFYVARVWVNNEWVFVAREHHEMLKVTSATYEAATTKEDVA